MSHRQGLSTSAHAFRTMGTNLLTIQEVDTNTDETRGCWIRIEGTDTKPFSLIGYRDLCVYIWMWVTSTVFQICLLKPRGNDTPGTMSPAKPQILVSKHHSLKETTFLGELAASEAGVEEGQDESELPLCQKRRKAQRTMGTHERGIRVSMEAL